MPRLADFRNKKEAIMLHMPDGYEKTLALSHLMVDMERAYSVVPTYDKAWCEQNPDAYALYAEIEEARYPKEVSKVECDIANVR